MFLFLLTKLSEMLFQQQKVSPPLIVNMWNGIWLINKMIVLINFELTPHAMAWFRVDYNGLLLERSRSIMLGWAEAFLRLILVGHFVFRTKTIFCIKSSRLFSFFYVVFSILVIIRVLHLMEHSGVYLLKWKVIYLKFL